MNKMKIGKNLESLYNSEKLLLKMRNIKRMIDCVRSVVKVNDVEWDGKQGLLFTIRGKFYFLEIENDEYLSQCNVLKLIETVIEDANIFNTFYLTQIMKGVREDINIKQEKEA